MVLHGEEKGRAGRLRRLQRESFCSWQDSHYCFASSIYGLSGPVKNGDGFKPSSLLCLLIPLMQSTSARPGEAPPLCLRWRWSPVNGQ